MNNLRFACIALALGTALAAGCTSSDNGPDATLRVQNDSDFDIVRNPRGARRHEHLGPQSDLR